MADKQFGIEWHVLKPWHKFLGAISLLLVSLHIGSHWIYLRDNISRRFPFFRRLPRVLTAVLLAGTLCFGGWSYVDSDFGKWIAAPLIASPHQNRPQDGSGKKKHQKQPFSVAALAKLMAEVSAMLYLGAYVVKGNKGKQVPGKSGSYEKYN